MVGVVRWNEKRGEVPLVPPPSVREYASLTDDPDRFGGGYSIEGVRGVAFAIEYLDSHGWVSTRTVRCLGVDTRHPASFTAYCHVRDKVCKFRVDRIISIIDFRSGRVLSSDEHLALLAPYLPDDSPEPYLSALVDIQTATRDGVFALLHISMPEGRLADRPRAIVHDYVRTEAGVLGLPLPSFELVELWIDNLAPTRDAVTASVTKLLGDKAKFARLMPWLLKIVRSQDSFLEQEDALRELMAEVRAHFRESGGGRPGNRRASS